MVRVIDIDWSSASMEHIARHAVKPDEVEDVVYGDHYSTRARDGMYRFTGQTVSGRYLTVILVPRGGGLFGVVTARDATTVERRSFRKR